MFCPVTPPLILGKKKTAIPELGKHLAQGRNERGKKKERVDRRADK